MKKQHILLLLVLTVIYGFLTFIMPADPQTLAQYNMSELQLHLLTLTLVVPIALIWAAAFYGFSKFQGYAEYIKDRPDGKHLAKVAQGLEVMAIGLVATTILGSLLQNISHRNLGLVEETVIAQNYLLLIISLVAYYLIYKGAKGLTSLVETKPSAVLAQWWFWVYLVLSGAYAFTALTSPVKNIVASSSKQGLYYLPDALIAATIIIPYVIAWFLGIYGARLISLYQHNTDGIIYKAALSKLSSGMIIIVSVAILLQFFTLYIARHSDKLADTSLSSLLLLIYLLIAIIAFGYLVIAQGAKKLKLIEEV